MSAAPGVSLVGPGATSSNRKDAETAARQLLEGGLIGCANFFDGVDSMFMWEGEIASSQECGVLLKTDAQLLKPAIERLEELHPYETPAILCWNCDEAGAATREWLGSLCKE